MALFRKEEVNILEYGYKNIFKTELKESEA